MPNTKTWTDPDGQITNTGPSTSGVYLIDPVTQKAISPAEGGGGTPTDINLKQVGGASIALGQTTMSASLPVTLSSNQSEINVNIDEVGGLTPNIAKETGGHLATIDTNTLPPGQAVMASSSPVVIASNQSAVPISGTVTTTPPSNASTNVTQIGGSAISEGQNTMANSIPVVIASNQSNVPISGTVTTTPPSNASTNLTQVGGASISEGQTIMANSLPVAIASDNGIATSANQTTANTSLSTIATNTTGAAKDTSVNGLLNAQGSTTSGQSGPLIQAAVTTSSPSYTNGQTSPITQTTSGGVRAAQSGNWNVQQQASATGGYTYTNITTATTTAIKSGAGTLHSVTVNTPVGNGVIEIDDATSHTTPKIATITFPAVLLNSGPVTALYDIAFTTGLNITTTTSGMDITVAWK